MAFLTKDELNTYETTFWGDRYTGTTAGIAGLSVGAIAAIGAGVVAAVAVASSNNSSSSHSAATHH